MKFGLKQGSTQDFIFGILDKHWRWTQEHWCEPLGKMVTGLYGSLAASASVFIGILTALLTSKLTSLRSERGQIKNRLTQIQSRRENLQTQRENIEKELDEVKGPESVYSLRQRKQRTIPPIPDRYKDPIPPGHVSPASEEEQEELEEWEKFNQQVASSYNLQLENVETDLESLKQEHIRLKSRYESLDFSDIKSTLNTSFWAIFLAVLIPSGVYFLRTTGLTFIPAPVAAEAGLVLIAWATGLFYVLFHIRHQIQYEDETARLGNTPDFDTEESD